MTTDDAARVEIRFRRLCEALDRLIALLEDESNQIVRMLPETIAAMAEAKQQALTEIEQLAADPVLLSDLESTNSEETVLRVADVQLLKLKLGHLSEAVEKNRGILDAAKQAIKQVTDTVRDAVSAAQTDTAYDCGGSTVSRVTGEYAQVDRNL